MTARLADFFPEGINQYVPNMQYHDAIDLRNGNRFTLGTPAAPDDDALDTDIDADAVATTETVQSWTADSPYGRTLTMTMSADPGNAAVIDVYGFDYLGQLMTERFTHVNGSAPVIYGKKAFYRVYKSVIVTAASNAVTCKLGTGYRLGLPFKGTVLRAIENGSHVEVYNRDFWSEHAVFNAVDAAAGSSRFLNMPCAGFIKTLRAWHNVAGSTNDPVITVEIGGNAVTGLTVTPDVSGTAGTVVTDVPTTPGYSYNNRFREGDRVEIVSAAAASADEFIAQLELTPTQNSLPDETDPATSLTGDTRGTYESNMDMDGTAEIEVEMVLDNSANASGNGGLHGIVQV